MSEYIGTLAWSDVIPNEKRKAHGDSAIHRWKHKSSARRDDEHRPMHSPACQGQDLDVIGLARHFGCGPRAAIEHANRLGWQCGEELRRGSVNRNLALVRVWTVKP